MTTTTRSPRTTRREQITRDRAVQFIRKHADAGKLVVVGRGPLPLADVLALVDVADAFHMLTHSYGQDLALTTSGSPAATRIPMNMDVLYDF